jgi:hypothetical protein
MADNINTIYMYLNNSISKHTTFYTCTSFLVTATNIYISENAIITILAIVCFTNIMQLADGPTPSELAMAQNSFV